MNDWDVIDFDYKNYEIGGKTFRLTFTDTHIRLNQVTVAYDDIEALRCGVYPPYRARGWTFSLELRSQSNQKLSVEFHCGRLSREKLQERTALWNGIMQVTTERILHPMVLAAYETIREGGAYKVGRTEATREGLNLKVRRWLFATKSVFIPWANVTRREENDFLHLSSNVDSSCEVSCWPSEWNSLVLRRLLDLLLDGGGLAEFARSHTTSKP